MSSLLLASLLQVAAGDISIAQAEALARRDEESLQGELASQFSDRQGKAMGRAMVACNVQAAGEMAGIMVVMRLNAVGQVTQTWLNKQSELGQCFEERIRSEILPADGRSEFFSFVKFNF